ncbi:MAG: polar amino acid transport system substrate-binding protein [Chloroflexota bacterium]|jgi:polar amino acid transport system substrate-binding protein|nr:polar amino acid transport system substrate-binding protein [Chloroflexota bacterium]
MRSTLRAWALALTTLIALAACTGAGASPTSTAPASQPPASSVVASPSPSADACAKEHLAVVAAGKLTIGTDNPAYPPYFAPKTGGNTPPWDPSQGDPTTGQGFESAVGFAIAKQLGFATHEVTWIVVPFANSFAPGAKAFDLDLNQVSYKAERTQAADLSDGYYFGPQTVVTLKTSKFAKATTIAELLGAKVGAQVGTTSYDAITNVIKPSADPLVYDTNDAAIEALKNKQIDAIVVDLPTADFITNVQLDGSVVVGQLDQGTPEHFSAVLAKGSPLTECVNGAIKALTVDGTLAALVTKWLPFSAAPVLKP